MTKRSIVDIKNQGNERTIDLSVIEDLMVSTVRLHDIGEFERDFTDAVDFLGEIVGSPHMQAGYGEYETMVFKADSGYHDYGCVRSNDPANAEKIHKEVCKILSTNDKIYFDLLAEAHYLTEEDL